MDGITSGKATAAIGSEADRMLEGRFVETLEAVEEYIAQQGTIASHLKSGFLNLARARYQMGSSKVGPAQYPAVMYATARTGAPPRAREGGCSATDEEATTVASDVTDSRECDAAAEISSTPQPNSSSGGRQHHHVASEYGSSLIDELAAQFESTDVRDGAAAASEELSGGGSRPEKVATQLAAASQGVSRQASQEAAQQPAHYRSTISWFGVMVSPDLRAAQTDFGGALQAARALAQAHRAVQSGVESYIQQSIASRVSPTCAGKTPAHTGQAEDGAAVHVGQMQAPPALTADSAEAARVEQTASC